MRLGFHYHVPAVYENGQIRMPGYQGRFIESLANECDEVICFLHTPGAGEYELMDHRIESPNVKFVELGIHNSVPRRLMQSRVITNKISEWQDNLDVILLRGPSPLLPLFARIFHSTPIALLIVGDNAIGVNDLPQPWWRKQTIKIFQNWNKYKQIKTAEGALTFVNSRERYKEYNEIVPNAIETLTTTLTQSDFFKREDTCATFPIKLLYSGRIDRAKGLFELVEAISILNTHNLNVILDIVGWPQKNDIILSELESFAIKIGVAERVKYHGYKPLGPELFKYYKSADIYVIASKFAFEGFPRSIWEAMAHSLPVVATGVGSIPDFISNTSIIVEPSSSIALADGIKKMIFDKKLRKEVIKLGRNLAKENTLEKQSRIMIGEIEKWLLHYE